MRADPDRRADLVAGQVARRRRAVVGAVAAGAAGTGPDRQRAVDVQRRSVRVAGGALVGGVGGGWVAVTGTARGLAADLRVPGRAGQRGAPAGERLAVTVDVAAPAAGRVVAGRRAPGREVRRARRLPRSGKPHLGGRRVGGATAPDVPLVVPAHRYLVALGALPRARGRPLAEVGEVHAAVGPLGVAGAARGRPLLVAVETRRAGCAAGEVAAVAGSAQREIPVVPGELGAVEVGRVGVEDAARVIPQSAQPSAGARSSAQPGAAAQARAAAPINASGPR